MSPDQWLQEQANTHPQDIDLGLDVLKNVINQLQIAQPHIPIISVAGTNGKGSTVAMTASILQAIGLNVGVFSSPHFVHYRERIQINNEAIDDDKICQYFDAIRPLDPHLTYFEYGTIAAMMAFIDRQVDVIILEVGLGGRLDAVNAWNANVAILTTVDLDHQAWLGDTREQIGFEKAGIFRPNCPAIVGVNMPQTVLDYAKKIGAILKTPQAIDCQSTWDFISDEILINDLLLPSLVGRFQIHNAALAINATWQIAQKKNIALKRSHINQGLTKVRLTGRMQYTTYQNRSVLLDVAHNPQAMTALTNHLTQTIDRCSISAIFGVMTDKDIEQIICLVNPLVSRWLLIPLPSERAMSPAALAAKLHNHHHSVKIHTSCLSALDEALHFDEQIVVFGSFFSVSEFLQVSTLEKVYAKY